MLKKVWGYIVAFVTGIIAVILAILLNNRRRIDSPREHFDTAKQSLNRVKDSLNDSIERTEQALEGNRTAQDIIRKVRERGKAE